MQFTDTENLYQTILNAPIGMCLLDAGSLVAELVNDKFVEVAGKNYEAMIRNKSALAGVVQTGEPYYAKGVDLMLARHGHEEMVSITFVYSPIKRQRW